MSDPIPDFNVVRIIVQRFELNDSENPAFYIVGFRLVCDLNKREKYFETVVDYSLCLEKEDTEICNMAYKNLKTKIESARDELILGRFIVGTEFVPPVDV
jgi:hypothetical protein